jgi:hypothetical protein
MIVVFDVLGTEVVAEMTEGEFADQVLNNHGNMTRVRYPYRFVRKANADAALKAKAKKVRINDLHDPAIVAAKQAKKAEQFAAVVVAKEQEKIAQKKKIDDAIKAKKAGKE